MKKKITSLLTRDISFWLLLFTNLGTFYFAIRDSWDILALIWVYWFQSVIIGVFNVIRIMEAKKFTMKGMTEDGQPVPDTNEARKRLAIFFAFHYGAFHVAYVVGFSNFHFTMPNPWHAIWIASVFFLLNHAISYILHRSQERQTLLNVGNAMMFPYARIIPMHLTAMSGGISVFIFVPLKIIADQIMHVVHSRMRSKREL